MRNNLPVIHNPELHDFVLNLLLKYPSGRLLDIPSGPGYFCQRAKEKGFAPLAAEIDESLHVLPNVSYKKVNMNGAFPFEAKNFDYIVSIEGIEHIENQVGFLAECSRVLKDSGKIILTTPNVSSLENRLGFFLTGFHDNPPRPIRSDGNNRYFEHINLIPFYRLEAFFRFAGFNILQVTTNRFQKGSLFLYPFFAPFIRRRLIKSLQKYFKNDPVIENYRKNLWQHWSKTVLCGGILVIVAEKKAMQ